MTPSPPPRNRLLLHNYILWPNALHNADKERMCKHIRMRHSTIHSAPDVVNDLEWVGKLSGPLLLNNNLFVRRDMSCVLNNRRRLSEHRVRYTIEPFDVLFRILPRFHLWDRPTPIFLGKDMDHEISTYPPNCLVTLDWGSSSVKPTSVCSSYVPSLYSISTSTMSLPTMGMSIRHATSSSVTVISPTGRWKLLVFTCYLSDKAVKGHGWCSRTQSEGRGKYWMHSPAARTMPFHLPGLSSSQP